MPVPVIYVGNVSTRTVLAFAEGTNGDVAPLVAFMPPAPSVDIALDGAGNLYSSDFNGNAITVFAPGATGAATPIRTIVGPATQIHRPRGIFVDTGGNLYVAGRLADNPPTAGAVLKFAPGANGNVAPINVIDGTGFIGINPTDVAVSPSGEVAVANFANGATTVVYAPGATGNATPQQVIPADQVPLPPPAIGTQTRIPIGVVFDSTGTLYETEKVASQISVFTKNGSGQFVRVRKIEGPTLSTASVRLLDIDEVRRKIYVTDFVQAVGTVNTFIGKVYEFPMDASGTNVEPTTVIAGSNTGLGTTQATSSIQGIAVSKCNVISARGSRLIRTGSTCALDNAQVSGSILVEPGATLMIRNSTIGGSIDAQGAAAIRICGTKISGGVRTTRARSVVMGTGDLCAPNMIARGVLP